MGRFSLIRCTPFRVGLARRFFASPESSAWRVLSGAWQAITTRRWRSLPLVGQRVAPLRPAPLHLAPLRLERRRVLDAGAAELLYHSLVGSGEFLQTSSQLNENVTPPETDPASLTQTDPTSLELFLGASEIFEDEVLQLGVMIDGPKTEIAHTAIIDWGDGTPQQTFTFDPGSCFLGTSHHYADDGPSATPQDDLEIRVALVDSLGNTTTATATVTVKNVAPTIDTLSITSPTDEFQFVTLSGTYSDPGTRDTFLLDVDWDGDTVFDQSVVVSGGTFQISRQVLDDNPTGTPSDTVDVLVQLRDDDAGLATQSAVLTIHNVPPSEPFIFRFDTPVDEADVVEILVSFQDPGILDSHTIEIDWGDASVVETIDVPSGGARFFLLSHLYADDNPTQTASDWNQIRVTVTDDDGGQSSGVLPVLVKNVAPTLTVASDQVIDEGTLLDLTGGGLGAWTDVGSLDTHTAVVDWGDGTPWETVTVNQGHGSGTLDASHYYADNGRYRVNVVLSDDDGGSDSKSFFVQVNNVAPDLVVVGDQTIDEGAVLQLTDLGIFTDRGFDNPYNTLDPSNGGQTEERFFYKIDWGDSTLTNLVAATIDQPGSAGIATRGSFDGEHIYADDGLYTVTVQLLDDDGGFATATFQVVVNNVLPTLDGIDPVPIVHEGDALTLAELGVSISDPGFDNPFNPLEFGGSQETLTALDVDWGDGSPVDSLRIVNRVSGGPGLATTADFEHAPHTYADNGLYTVTLAVADDDGGLVRRSFQIQVMNVAPTLILTDRGLEISESETLDLFDLATFSDPGFDNLFNVGDPSNGGEVTETFTYTIDWGDGTVETGLLPAQVMSGEAGQATLGNLADSHQYLDNDLDGVADNLYTITVTLDDDDGGTVTQSILVRVLNINPSLEPIAALDLNTRGETTLTLEFADPGTEQLTVWVDWGDRLALPPADRFVPELFVPGPGTQNVTLQHTYDGPPNPSSPASDILISAFIRDDDFGMPRVVDLGQSETQRVAISNPGAGVNPVVIDTTPQVPRLLFPRPEEGKFFANTSAGDEGALQTTDLRTAVGDTKSTTDRFLELRVLDPASGEAGEGYRLKAEVLNDLPGLFRTLPDNRYAIYLVRTETNTRRLVIEVYVRNGKLIDPGDDSEGTRDRPPTDETAREVIEPGLHDERAEPILEAPANELPAPSPGDSPAGTRPVTPADVDAGAAWPVSAPAEPMESAADRQSLRLGVAALGFAATRSRRSWGERIDQAIATADAEQWRRLRRRPPNHRN